VERALLVIDMQNGFLHPEGSGTLRGLEVAEVDQLIRHTQDMIGHARDNDIPVLYTRHCHRADLSDMAPAIRRRYPGGTRPLVNGSWDAAIVDALRPDPDDIEITKNRYDAFLHTHLDQALRLLGAHQVTVAGVLTDMCVESTVRSAEQRDYRVSVAADCTGAATPSRHETSLGVMANAFATVAPWREVLART
jgi:ureidoacrylate peracid hydrolase